MIKRKLKFCIDCGKECYIFGYKRCQSCYNKFKNYKLNPVSDKEKVRKKEYMKLRKAYLLEHPKCEVCGINDSTEIHHKAGRIGENLFRHFLAIDRDCHTRIHFESNWEDSVEKGYIIPQVKKNTFD